MPSYFGVLGARGCPRRSPAYWLPPSWLTDGSTGISVLPANSPVAGKKGRQVAERGQQNLGQPVAQAREELWPQAGGLDQGRNTQKQAKKKEGWSQEKEVETQMGVEMEVLVERQTETNRDTEKQTQRKQ